MSLDERVSELIKRIYCAGEDNCEWDRIAIDALDLTGAHAALISLTDLKRRDLTSFRAYGPNDTRLAKGLEEYREKYLQDPSLRWGSEHPFARFCDSSKTIASPREYLQDDYVRWNLDRFGSTHWYVGYTAPKGDLSFTFSVHFPATHGPADKSSIRLFRMLFDHMECAIHLERRPFDPESPRALLVLNPEGRVMQATAAAENLLRNGGALLVSGGYLRAAVPADQAKLSSKLAAASCVSATGCPPTPVKVAHPYGQRPWLLTVRPCPQKYGPFGSRRPELLVEIHRYSPPMENLEILQAFFGLTKREVELIRLLAKGHSIETSAAEMNISPATTRTHLRSIFSKTHTSRQSELLLLCAGICQA